MGNPNDVSEKKKKTLEKCSFEIFYGAVSNCNSRENPIYLRNSILHPCMQNTIP